MISRPSERHSGRNAGTRHRFGIGARRFDRLDGLPSARTTSMAASEPTEPEQTSTDSPEAPLPRAGRKTRRRWQGLSEAPWRDSIEALLRLVGIGFSLGLFVALLGVENLGKFSNSNALSPKLRVEALVKMVVPIGLLVLGALGYLFFRPRTEKAPRLLGLAKACAPLGWLWPAPLFFDWKVFGGIGLARAVLGALWAVGLERSLRTSLPLLAPFLRTRVKVPFSGRLGSLSFVSAVLLCAYFAWFTAKYTVLQHHLLATTGFDLGIFDNLFFNLKQGEWFRGTVDRGNLGGGAHIQYHANFLFFFLVPFYAIHPSSETLLVLQAVLVGFSGIPIYLVVRDRLESRGIALALTYLFLIHEGTQSPVFYDFHDLTLAPFFVGWTLYFFEKGKTWSLAVAWLCAVLLREDQGTVLGGAFLVYLLSNRRPLPALIFGVFGVVWLALMRFWIMPLHAPDGRFQQHIGIFQAMVSPGDHGFGGVLKTIATNPIFTLNNFLEQRKLEYVLAMAVPFLFIPFRRPLLLFLFVPASLFTLATANYAPPVSTRFQYAMYWMPMLVLGTLHVLDEWNRTAEHRPKVAAAVGAMLVVGTAMSFGAGGFFQQNTLIGGFRKVSFEWTQADQERFDRLRAAIAKIPRDAALTATESLVPHISTRRNAFTLRQGTSASDYLLVRTDEVRGGEQAEHLLQAARSGEFGFVEQNKEFQIWRRGAPTDENERVLGRLGHRNRPRR